MNHILLFLSFVTLLCGEELSKYEGKGISLKLICDHTSVSPGQQVTYGVSITHDKGYHSYWKNPGIIGYPFTLEWSLPEEIPEPLVNYPYPERIKMVHYPCYGYERPVTILSTFTVPQDYSATTISGTLKLWWMCCRDSCCPDETSFTIKLPVGEGTSSNTNTLKIIQAAKLELPTNDHQSSSRILSQMGNEAIKVELTIPRGSTPVHLYSSDNQSSSDVEQKFTLTKVDKETHTYSIDLPRYQFSPKNQSHFPFILQTTAGHYQFSPAYP